MLTPSVSESKMNSWRLSSHILPVRVRKSIAANHSASVGSTSRINACRCVTRLVMSRCRRGLGVFAKLLSTVSVMRSSLLSLIVQLRSFTRALAQDFLHAPDLAVGQSNLDSVRVARRRRQNILDNAGRALARGLIVLLHNCHPQLGANIGALWHTH